MQTVFKNQKSLFYSNQTKSVDFRKLQLRKLKNILKESETLLFEAIYLDFKKAKFETYTTELSLLYSEIDTALLKLNSWSKKEKVRTNFANFPAKSYIVTEPLGTILIIGAWNYPYQLAIAPAIAALTAGNTVILKPSEIAAHSSAAMAKIINESFDPSVFYVQEGGIEETTALLEMPFDKIFFTGSTQVGKIVYQAAAKNLTPVTLELGGKSPTFVCKDANLKMAAKRMVWAKFLNAGQTCIAPDYILVEETIKDEFLKEVVLEIDKTNYCITNENYVQIINYKNFERLEKLIDPSKIFFGGKTDKAERIIYPTILHNCTFDDLVMKEEIFGPILPIITYSNLDEVIAKVKVEAKPLSCYIFTSSSGVKNKIENEISFGGGCINDAIMHISNDKMPFGGVGASGMGNYHGKFGFDTFSHFKSILDKPTWLEFDFKYSPYTEWKQKIIKMLLG
jgi:aldehyde dehydrogenase (NAD+)